MQLLDRLPSAVQAALRNQAQHKKWSGNFCNDSEKYYIIYVRVINHQLLKAMKETLSVVTFIYRNHTEIEADCYICLEYTTLRSLALPL